MTQSAVHPFSTAPISQRLRTLEAGHLLPRKAICGRNSVGPWPRGAIGGEGGDQQPERGSLKGGGSGNGSGFDSGLAVDDGCGRVNRGGMG